MDLLDLYIYSHTTAVCTVEAAPAGRAVATSSPESEAAMMPTTLARKSGRPAPSVLCAPVGPPGKRAAARSSVTVLGRPPATMPAACASPSRQRMPRHACPFAAPPSPPGSCPAPAPAQAGKRCAAGVHTGCAHRVLRRRARLVAAPPRRPLAGPAGALRLRQPKPAKDAPQVCIPVLPKVLPKVLPSVLQRLTCVLAFESTIKLCH